MVGQDLLAAILLAQPVGHKAPGDAPNPGAEILTSPEFSHTLVGDHQGVLRDVIDGFRADAEHTNEATQTRLLAAHLLHEPFCVAVGTHAISYMLCCREKGRRYTVA